MSKIRADQIFEDIIATIREPLLVLDSDLKVIAASRSFYKFFKVKPEETVGQLIYELGNKQWNIPKLRELLETILPQKTTFDDYEVEHDFTAIGKRTMLLNARQLKSALGKERGILLAIEDITDRKQSETLLKDSEERYRRLFETADDGIMLLGKSELKIRQVNPAIMAMLGYSREELIGNDLKGLGFPDEFGGAQEILSALDQRGIAHYKNVAMQDKAGRAIVADIYMTDRSHLVQCNVRDITERKKAQDKLLASVQLCAEIINAIPVRVFWKDKNLVFLGCNAAFARDAGFTDPQNIIGKDDYQMVWRDQADSYRAADLQVIESGCAKLLIEEPQTTPEGKVITLLTNKIPLHNSNGDIIGILGTYMDITERKQADQENEKLKAQLFQAQKMEAIGTLAGGIAHDFNNILSAVIGYTELAQMNLESDSEINDDLKEVLVAGERAKNLVKQILSFSRQGQQEQIPVQTGLIVKEALKLIKSSLPSTIDVRQNIQSKSIVLCDPTQIHQIVMNLCTNAAHALRGKNGILNVVLSDVVLDHDFCSFYPELQPGAYQKLTVSDTGHGMTADVRNRIFEPFFTTKPKNEGTGLGLPVVHGIVKGLGGTVTVYSEPDKGTTLNLYFPIIEGEAKAKSAEPASIPTGTERILLVEDEKAILNLTQKHLASLGYAVEIRTSSLAALELFEAKPDQFDLVITDMTMPQMTGTSLARELIKIRPDLPVILCTGFSENITTEKAAASGIKALLFKPLLKKEMAQAIRKALDEVKGPTQK